MSRRIYVADVAAYNAGNLRGIWLDVDGVAEDDLAAQIQDFVGDGDWRIDDLDGDWCKIKPADLADVILHSEMLDKHAEAWGAYVDSVGMHYATEDDFDDRYSGAWDSAEDYAQNLVEDIGDFKSMGNLANYIDWERFARDLGYDGYSFVGGEDGKVHVFHP